MPLDRAWLNASVDDDGSGTVGTPVNKAYFASIANAIDNTMMDLAGSNPMTGSLTQQFSGLFRIMTPAGGARVREYGDLVVVGTGGFEWAMSFNVPITLAGGIYSWGGRDTADICWLIQMAEPSGAYEIWQAPTGAAGSGPTWTRQYQFDTALGKITTFGANAPDGSLQSNAVYNTKYIMTEFSGPYPSGATSFPLAGTPLVPGWIPNVNGMPYYGSYLNAGNQWYSVWNYTTGAAYGVLYYNHVVENITSGLLRFDTYNYIYPSTGGEFHAVGWSAFDTSMYLSKGAYITWDSTSGLIHFVSRDDAGTQFINATTVAIPNPAREMRMMVELTPTYAKYYLDGTLVATNTSNLPSTTGLKAGMNNASSGGVSHGCRRTIITIGA